MVKNVVLNNSHLKRGHSVLSVAVLPVLLINVVLLLFIILTSSTASADDGVVDHISVTVPVSCTLSGTGIDSHVTTITNGTYVSDIGTTTLKAFCNDVNGFSIYAIGFTKKEYGNNKLASSISSAFDITTGTATSGNTSNWAMKLTANTGAGVNYPITLDNGYGSYSAVPSTYTKVAHRDFSTDMGTNAQGSTLTTTYASYFSQTQPADTYAAKVKYTLVHPVNETPLQPQITQSGKACYYPNGSNVIGTMGCQDISSSDTSTTLLASNYSREGYGFAGWSKTPDYYDPADSFGPQETIEFEAGTYTGSNPGLSLYAHWVKSAGSLQGYTCPNDTAMPIGTITALTDQRDNQTYAVAKLADSNCWMIENLRLESTASGNSTGELAQGYGTSGTYGNFSGLATVENTGFTSTYSANSLYYGGTQEGTASIDIGDSQAPLRMPRYNNINTNSRASNPANSNVALYSYGNYYTWSAAIADTSKYETEGQSVTGTSLCPSGWRLPLGGTSNGSIANSGKFAYLDIKLGGYGGSNYTAEASNRWRKYPNNFVYSGMFSDSSATDRGSKGVYWSSTVGNIFTRTSILALESSAFSIGGGLKYTGFSIRCLALSGT